MTNGDAMRKNTNEELAEFVANDRINILQMLFEKFGVDDDLKTMKREMHCAILEWLNKEKE